MTNTAQPSTTPELTQEGLQMVNQLEACVQKLHTALQGELVTVGAAACIETAVSLILAPSTPASLRMQFTQLLMDQAHALSAKVSEEQADGPATIQHDAKPQIYLGN